MMEQQNDNEEKQEKEEEEEEQQQQQVQKIWSWGAGTEGQLGTGRLEDEHLPQLLLHLSSLLPCSDPISQLACGGAHVIALTSGRYQLPPTSSFLITIQNSL